jgi:uroporphyrinogen-III decarboxylase
LRLGDDFRRVYARYAGPAMPLTEGATYCTVFGIQRHGLGYGQPLSHPLAEAGLKQVHDYAWPDPGRMDVSAIRAEAEQHHQRYAILGGDWSPFWHDAIDLLGMENMMIKMHTDPELVEAVMQHLVDYYTEVSRRIFEAAALALDIFFIGNDLGGQTGPLLGVPHFRRFVLPHLTRLIRLGHDYRLRVQLHCCGGFLPLIPDMIAAGLDAVHAVQPCCGGMDLVELKRCFGRELVLNGGIDSHHVLIRGTPASVREQTRQVLNTMMPGGGYVAGASHDTILEETPVENVLAMVDAVQEFGVYRAR